MTALDCPYDLLVRARRPLSPPLSIDEQRELDRHLPACESCRMSLAITRAVGPLPPVDDRDQALAARLLAAAPQIEPGRPRRKRLPAMMAASLLLASSVAAAALWSARPASVPPAAPAPAEPSVPGPRRFARQPAPAAVPIAPVPAAQLAQPAAAPVRAPGRPRSRPIVPPGPGLTAGGLFRAANDARQAQQTVTAIALYRQLQASFPASPEAKMSLLSLADLLVARDETEQALALYQAYIDSGETTMLEEAVLGKARALARLGRAAEERALWEQFLEHHPRSDYRWRAQQRLDQLSP